MYCIHIKGKSEYLLDYDAKRQLVRGTPHLAAAETFHTYSGAAEMARLLTRAGIPGEVVSRDDEADRAIRRRKVESSIPSGWDWLISSPQTGHTADGRVFLKANGQTIYASTAAELIDKVAALADSFDQWREWLTKSKPAPEPIVPRQKRWYGVEGNGCQPLEWFPSLEKAEAEAARLRARLRPADQNQIRIVETV